MIQSPALRHPIRVLGRLIWLLAEILLAGLHYPFRRRGHGGRGRMLSRAAWLQTHCRRVLKVLHVEIQVEGPVPAGGFLACNHLSYVDILALSALSPAVFVAKYEVRGWPVFGWFARLGGTIFVRRDQPRHVKQSAQAIQATLDQGVLVVIFPEGTSSGGETVLPFKSSLLGAADPEAHPVHAGCIHYPDSNGRVSDEICYWRDMTLVPHLLNLMGRRGILVRLAFHLLEDPSPDRRLLARQLHAEVFRMKRSLASDPAE